jgi:hypothetical protein
MPEYGLIEPFEVDGGELDGLRPQEIFALGVEWEMFRRRLVSGHPFTVYALSNNAGRLNKLAERSGRFVETRPAKEGWSLITVGTYRV